MIHRLCFIDHTVFLPHLDSLAWLPANHPGCYAMIDELPDTFPVDYAQQAVQPFFPGHRRGKTMLSRLVPGQRIEPHCDHHDHCCKSRVHVPLTTSHLAMFTSGEHTMHMRAGAAYVIDPSISHSVYNGGKSDRIHLIFNMVLP